MVVPKKTKPFQDTHTENNQTTSKHSYSMTFQHVLQAHPKKDKCDVSPSYTRFPHYHLSKHYLSQHFIASF